jgi:MFS family permease
MTVDRSSGEHDDLIQSITTNGLISQDTDESPKPIGQGVDLTQSKEEERTLIEDTLITDTDDIEYHMPEGGDYKSFYKTTKVAQLRKKKLKYYKNLILLSFAFLFAITAVTSLSNLQSSLNKQDNIGVNSLLISSFTYLFSCLFLPGLFINLFGYKWSIFISLICQSSFIYANFFPRWYTLYPTGFLMGLVSGPLWTIQGCLIADLANYYVEVTRESLNAVMSEFFGIFMIIFQFQQVIGNLMSSLIFKTNNNSNHNSTNDQQWSNKSDQDIHCGVYDRSFLTDTIQQQQNLLEHDLNVVISNVTNFETIPQVKPLFLLCGILAAFSITGILMIGFFVDNIKPKTKLNSSIGSLVKAVKMFADWRALLLVPIQGAYCFVQVYVGADFTKSFISCIKGVEYVGYWFVAFGLIASLSAFLIGHLVKLFGRIPFFVTGFMCIIGLHTFMFFWNPKANDIYIVFLFTIFYGWAEGVWSTQINSIIGTIFPNEEQEAFANNRLTQSIIFVIAWISSIHLRITHKLIVIILFAIFSLICYILLEVLIKFKEKTMLNESKNKTLLKQYLKKSFKSKKE